MDEIVVRRAATFADYRACQEAQRQAWGITSDGYLVPVATLVGAQLHGGLVLGAFRPDGSAVGLSFGFLGRLDGRLCLYSQLTGVIPDLQSHGIGRRLKQAQLEYARTQGLPLVVWAFDPLQAGNAHFNLAHLGATAHHYIVDMYGPRDDVINVGLPTDRLIVEWSTEPRTPPTVDEPELARLPRLIAVRALATATTGPEAPPSGSAESSVPLVAEIEPVKDYLGAPRLLLEIPVAIAALRSQAPAEAARWQAAVRTAFTVAFDQGYRAIGFARWQVDGQARRFYILDKE